MSQSLQLKNLASLMDVPMHIEVELGRTKMPIADILSLTHGSIVELDRLAGEPLDILVNGKLIARGEAVIVNEKLSVRITEIVEPIAISEKMTA